MDHRVRTNDSLKSVGDLVDHGLVAPDIRAELEGVSARYAIAITPAMLDLIDPDDPNDPIARQFVPDVRELDQHPSEKADPISDGPMTKTPGLVHRYPDRVLLKLVDVCPVYCRFCFRREMVGPKQQGQLPDADIEDALAYIAAHEDIWEVIVTGGDPLMLSPRRLRQVVQSLNKIGHVKVVRWHSRIPAVAPELITPDLIAALTSGTKTIYVALHANHARELTATARSACRDLIEAGITMISQTVLLRGVNDDPTSLTNLMRAFVETGIKPYYLHHGDLAPGTAHFRTTIREGQAIMQAMRGQLSGIAQPTYVLDIPGAHGKVPVAGGYIEEACGDGFGSYTVRDPQGRRHHYNDCCAPPQAGKTSK